MPANITAAAAAAAAADAAANSTQHTKVQPWKAAWPPTNPREQSARPKLITHADGTPLVDVIIIILGAGLNCDPTEFSDLLADGSKGHKD